MSDEDIRAAQNSGSRVLTVASDHDTALQLPERASNPIAETGVLSSIADVARTPADRQLCPVEQMPHRPVERPVTVV
jgi:hypothetical protein